MRQVGILAAAGLYALKNNVERLKEDHEKAKFLAERINANPNLEIDLTAVQTNILLFHPKTISVEEGLERCKEKGLLVSVGKINLIRAVTHLDVSFDDVKRAANIIDEVFA
jgi:threonine aldolase